MDTVDMDMVDMGMADIDMDMVDMNKVVLGNIIGSDMPYHARVHCIENAKKKWKALPSQNGWERKHRLLHPKTSRQDDRKSEIIC